MTSEQIKSWSSTDHIRHYLYEGIFDTLNKESFPQEKYDVLDFGSKWFGDPDGGWQTNMRWMFKDILGPKLNHILATYPEYDVEVLAPCADSSIDILVADQVLEHVARPWVAAEQIYRVLKPGGIAVIATPGLYPIHKSPLDCWRILPDGYDVLFPPSRWGVLTRGMWGNAARVGFEYTNNANLVSGAPTYSVEEAMEQPYFSDQTDNLCPLQIWWVGRKRQ